MAFNDFISRVKTIGLPSSSKFLVEFLGTSNFLGGRDVSLMVDSCPIPGLNLLSIEQRIFGEITDSVYGISYPPINLSMYLDNSSGARKFFDEWTNRVWNRQSRTIGYYNDFIRDVKITLLDKTESPIYQIILREAWPKAINDIPLDYSNREIVKVNVQLVFKYWEVQPIDFEEILSARASVLNPTAETFKNRFSTSLNASDVFGATSGTLNQFQWGPPEEIGTALDLFGVGLGASISSAIGTLSNRIGSSVVEGKNAIQTTLNSLSSNFVQMGGGLKVLGADLGDVVPPVTIIATASDAIGDSLQELYSSLDNLGVATDLSNIASNFTNASGLIATVTNLANVPRNLQNMGGHMVALGEEFKKVVTPFSYVSGSTEGILSAFNRLGQTTRNQGESLYNGASSLKNYTEI